MPNWISGMNLEPIIKTITQNQINKYADASGDFNPLHINQPFARKSQFGRTIAHGMLIAASLSEMMGVNFGIDWHISGRMKLRFKAPVFPGDTATTFGEVKEVIDLNLKSEIVCVIGVKRQTGENAITGEARVMVNTNQ